MELTKVLSQEDILMPPENLSSAYMAYYTKGTSRKQWNNNSSVMNL